MRYATFAAALGLVAVLGCERSKPAAYEYGLVSRAVINGKQFCLVQLGSTRVEDDAVGQWTGTNANAPAIATDAVATAGREGWEVFQVEPGTVDRNGGGYRETYHLRRLIRN